MYNSCYIILCSSKKREQVIIIRDATAKEAAKEIPTSTSQSTVHFDSLPTSPLQKGTRFSTGFTHIKDQCVWCMKKEDKKNPNCPCSKQLRIEQTARWQHFERNIPFLKGTNIRRICNYILSWLYDRLFCCRYIIP